MAPSKHSKWSPSSAHSWMRCPSRIRLTENLRDEGLIPEQDEGNAYTREGTEAHRMLEIALASMIVPPGPEELRTAVEVVLEVVNQIIDIDHMHEIHIEDKVTIPLPDIDGIIDIEDGEVFGTCDMWWVDQETKTLHVFDFKFGMGNKVYAHENPQLMMYALGILGKIDPVQNVKLHVMQPRLSHLDFWEPTMARLEDFGAEVARAIWRSSDLHHFNPSDKNCKWCPAAGFCNARKEWAMKDFVICDSPERLPDDERLELFKKKDAIEKFLQDIEDGLLASLMQGQEIEGLEIAQKRTTRRYTEAAGPFLESRLGHDAYEVVRKPVGIGKAKQLGLTDEDINQITHKPEGAPYVRLTGGEE